ncbi:MAG: CDP-glucose 4,6-dehydratase, partial [Rhodospirillales bacterium]|nr:CDP-glucose 4,6-dehydratase [Rhodospirillales bacterium]
MSGFWHGRRVFVTGQTGFKGAWLCLWLERLGATVSAFALEPPTDPSLYALANGWPGQDHATGDLRDLDAVKCAVARADPQIILHLAAQALVRPGYRDPIGTFASNVMGTANLFEAARSLDGLEAVVVVTSDKVYENEEQGRPFIETDRLGGKDPYSSSKACAELVTRCYRDSFFAGGVPIATARAGNVIGGGDWAEARLVPDLVRALDDGQ